jgi:tRNA A-37 threonylcarbamoyl transferase component Bud32
MKLTLELAVIVIAVLAAIGLPLGYQINFTAGRIVMTLVDGRQANRYTSTRNFKIDHTDAKLHRPLKFVQHGDCSIENILDPPQSAIAWC